LPSQVFQVVAQRAKGWQKVHFASRPNHKGHAIEGTVSFGRVLVRTLPSITLYYHFNVGFITVVSWWGMMSLCIMSFPMLWCHCVRCHCA